MCVLRARDVRRRHWRRANGTTSTVYDGLTSDLVGQTGAVTGDNSHPTVLYQLGPDGSHDALTQTVAGSGTSLLDDDGQGNISLLVSTGSGSTGCAAAYDPFGTPAGTLAAGGNGVCLSDSPTAAGSTGNATWYRDSTRDGSTGSYQYGTRTYTPSNGAFTTPDNYRLSTPSTDLSVGTDPLTANTYTYVNGNPLNYTDSNGHGAQCSKEFAILCDSAAIAAGTKSAPNAPPASAAPSASVNLIPRGDLVGSNSYLPDAEALAVAERNRAADQGTQLALYSVLAGPLMDAQTQSDLTAMGNRIRTYVTSLNTQIAALDQAQAEVRAEVQAMAAAQKIQELLNDSWLDKVAGEIGSVVAGVAAGVLTTAGCVVATGGAGSVGCAVAGYAVGGAVSSVLGAANDGCQEFSCFGKAAGAGAVVGGVTGGLGEGVGAIFGKFAARGAADTVPEEASLYRGVASDHPGYNDALNGVARPRGGSATAAEHNLGDTRSDFTSWTTDPEVAKGMSYPGGVIMRVPQSSVAGRLVQSPDLFDESEVLIRGPVFGAGLLP